MAYSGRDETGPEPSALSQYRPVTSMVSSYFLALFSEPPSRSTEVTGCHEPLQKLRGALQGWRRSDLGRIVR